MMKDKYDVELGEVTAFANVQNVRELREAIKDLPDDLPVYDGHKNALTIDIYQIEKPHKSFVEVQ